MTATVSDLDRILTALPERQKRHAISLLAKLLMPNKFDETTEQMIEVLDDCDHPIGYFVSLVAIKPEQFPPLSASYRAEIDRRAATQEPSEPIEEFLKLLTSPTKAGQAGRKRVRRS